MVNLERQQSDLMSELRAYREQHTSLAELVGSTGILQETLYRQKQELLHKFKVCKYYAFVALKISSNHIVLYS